MEVIEQNILEVMKQAGKPLRPGDIAQTTGLTREVVSKTIKSLKKKGKITSPKRCFFAPAE